MITSKNLEDVFKTVGLPQYTYVKPPYYGEVRADIVQPGKHVLIQGPSGIGKTCIVFKIFEELNWSENINFKYISCRDDKIIHELEEFLHTANNGTTPSPPIIVIDDFHLLATDKKTSIGSTLKRLSDRAFQQHDPAKVILIGIPTTGRPLLSDSYDLGPRLGSYTLERASDDEISTLISEGERALNVLFDDHDILLAESVGNFWLAQYICNKVCAINNIDRTQQDVKILTFDILGIRQRLMSELEARYLPIAKIFAKGKKWRPGGNKPYLEVLLAICKIPDSVIPFDKILSHVPEGRRPGIKAIKVRISEVIHDPGKHTDLRKQVAFDQDSGFSMEDPLFRYFLTNLDVKKLYRELGIEDDLVNKSTLYSYDIGFSFSGESRKIVELINQELKNEDIITFYDFDQQAFLLALDLETTLSRIYSTSCLIYLVFIDKNYKEKVWTRFEKDILINSNRKNHVIPILLEEDVGQFVGISSVIGRIDLHDIWSTMKKTGHVDSDVKNAIRNRCIVPVLERIGATDSTI